MSQRFEGRTAVVTGAARGIGRAVAARLAGEGLRVVVADLDGEALAGAARDLGAAAAVAADCATDEGLAALLGAAERAVGRVDLFVANAGTDAGSGLATPDAVWQRALDVNVLAHVRAARALVPGWVADGGGGRFVVTASAAGLLTMIGNAPYAVSKHAAVAFAEWLSVTYRDAGVVVQALCPQGVRTAMLEDLGPLQPLLDEGALEPEDVAGALWDALQDDRFLVLPHPPVREHPTARAGDPDRWLAGMNRLQQRLGVPREGAARGAPR